VELSDTAGLREANDELEAAGIAAAQQRLAEADLVVALFDHAEPWSDSDEALLAAYPGAVVVHNKADLPTPLDPRRPRGLEVSAVTGDGLPELITAIVARLVPNPPQPGDAVPFNVWHVEELQRLL
jgi:tRNA modification GTPase